jgi:steroid 5-alpha reductase family enzyme
MPPVAAAVIALVGLVLVFSAVWAWQLKSENAGMIDPVWVYSLGTVAVLYAVLGTGDPSTRALAALGGLIWGARLGTHLWRRNFGQPEDARYHRFREAWGDAAPRRMFWFFQLQVVISMLLSVAFLVPAYRSSEPATVWILLAVAVWIASVTGEGLADRQLRRFKNDPSNRGKVCRVGLWRYSRHPNYFFADGVAVAEALGYPVARSQSRENAGRLRRIHAHHECLDSVAAAALGGRVAA